MKPYYRIEYRLQSRKVMFWYFRIYGSESRCLSGRIACSSLQRYSFSFLCIMVLFLAACSGGLERKEYVAWVHDSENGLHVKKEHGNYIFDLQFQPTEYVLLQRIGDTSDTSQYRSARKEIETTQYYTLTVSIADQKTDFINYQVHDMSEKQRKLYYFSYQFQNDIRLEENGQELPCVLFHFERPVDLRPARTFVLGFENPFTASKESTLVITSGQFGSIPIRIKVSKENIPTLKL